ncbi:hypothetical protein AWH56_018270 [Anaerobacillus isosaccharinicus]|uniref:Uncharacterized protein n=1 Tax=Anaerobacillus isosaccharinicus TaxID=1532552 RepID=A0A1S2LES8_9BACI|nr:hypothetical protein [Anaerobacillus isosaccharinicus]MBA5587148.1 hypothetical protein [Anaerobacillus isosaccharinicus]QOY34655.1 hypothetical protein AWH56_018270 [Anaerobacillus isosaccharinicus]
MKKPVGVQLEGTIYSNDGKDLGSNQFMDEFIKFNESKGWSFGGGIYQINEEGSKIDDID